MNKFEILDKLAENVKNTGKVQLEAKDGSVQLVRGALGEMENCASFVEETRKDPMWQTKYYGVSRWFKGITDNDIIDRVTITKRAFREIVSLFPLNIKRLLLSLWLIYACEGGLKSKVLKDEEFCPVCQEIIRAGKKTFIDERIDLIYCLAMFLQFSPSYRLRVQDIAGTADKSRLIRQPVKELWRLMRAALKRERAVRGKVKLAFLSLIFIAIVSRELFKKSVEALDFEKVGIDDADWYYCLRRPSYDFCGLTLAERLALADMIDKREDNLIIEL
jgi:hypothetical protein